MKEHSLLKYKYPTKEYNALGFIKNGLYEVLYSQSLGYYVQNDMHKLILVDVKGNLKDPCDSFTTTKEVILVKGNSNEKY